MDHNKKITIKQIADSCGVSPVTVSRVIAGSASVKRETRDRILSSMAEMGYRSFPAEPAACQGSRLIAILASGLNNPTKIETINVMCQNILAAGYLPVICTGSGEYTAGYVESIQQNLYGIITTYAFDRQKLPMKVMGRHLPVLVTPRCNMWTTMDSVIVDDYRSAELAVEKLHAYGHRHIVFINNEERLPGAFEALSGYRSAMLRLGLEPNEDYTFAAPAERKYGVQIAETICKQHPEVTAYICVNEYVGWGVLDTYILKHGISAPEYVSVVTFDRSSSENPSSDNPTRRMTAVGSSIAEIASKAVGTILSLIETQPAENQENSQRQQRIILNPEFFVGETIAKARC